MVWEHHGKVWESDLTFGGQNKEFSAKILVTENTKWRLYWRRGWTSKALLQASCVARVWRCSWTLSCALGSHGQDRAGV